MKIDKRNGTCMYNDEAHVYWDSEDDSKYISVTTLIHKYCQEFDEAFWSAYKALEALTDPAAFKPIKSVMIKLKKFNIKFLELLGVNESDFNNKRAEIIQQWEDNKNKACERGTAIHLGKELEYYKAPEHHVKFFGLGGNFKCEKDHYEMNLDKGIYPEYLVAKKTNDGKLKIAGQIDLLIKDGNDIYIIDYKGLPLDTPVMTTNGFKLLKDITKKDIIFDKDGNTTNILNISEIHNNPCYKINFDNSESIVADHEHRWLISFRNNDKSFREKIMTTEEIKEYVDGIKGNRVAYNIPRIINAKPINTLDRKLPIDPYVLGAWLGDGSKACGVITNVNKDFWSEISKRGYEYSENLSREDKAEMRTVYGLRTELRKLNLLNNKHIPDIYLTASYSQRLDLLRGLMDTDGYYNETRRRSVMATGQEWQANDTAKLVSTLGWKPTILKCKKTCNGSNFDGWDVCFTTDVNPFLIRNQNIDFTKVKDNSSYRNIESVEIVETVETKCLEVDSPSHTFLAGYTMIPTHNTNKKLDKQSYFNPSTKKHEMMKYPLNNVMDCNMMHYTLQLSLYAYLLQIINPEFNVKQLMIIHYDHDGNETHHELEYKKKEIQLMLKHYKKTMVLEKRKENRKPIEY